VKNVTGKMFPAGTEGAPKGLGNGSFRGGGRTKTRWRGRYCKGSPDGSYAVKPYEAAQKHGEQRE